MADKPFDPDAYLAKPEEEKPAEPTIFDRLAGYGQTAKDAVRVGGNSATYGQWDRARAAGEVLTGGAPSYAEALQDKVTRSQEARERLGPLGAATAEAIGGTLTAAPLVRAGGMAVGTAWNAAKPLWQRMFVGGVEGGAHGAAQSTGHTYSDNPSDYIEPAVKGFGMGSLFGGAAPVLGAVGGAASRARNNTFPAELSKAADADRAGLMAMLRGENGPRAMLPDAGPSMLGTAQGSVPGVSGPGKTELVTNLRTRDQTSPAVVAGETDRIFGPAPTPSYVEAGVRDQMRGLSPAYNQALNTARAVDTNPAALWIEGEIGSTRGAAQGVLRNIRGMLDIPGNPGTLDPHPRSLQSTREAVRGMQNDPALADPNVQRVLGRTEEMLTRELQAKVPGIRQLDSQYAELGSQERAIRPDSPGARVFQTDRQNVQRPTELRDTLQEATQPKGVNVGPSAEAFRLSQAGRAELDRIIGTKKNDLLALENVLANPQDYNAQKLAIMFGQDRADQLARVLRNERVQRDTFQKVVEGSQTAARMEAAKAQEASSGKLPGDKTVWGRVEQAGQWGLNKLREHNADTQRDAIARIMATNDPATLQTLIPQLLAAEPDKRARAAITEALVTQLSLMGGAGVAAGQGGVVKRKPLPAGF
jgi:hypothetical protein